MNAEKVAIVSFYVTMKEVTEIQSFEDESPFQDS